jgi:hypothetical protein
VIEPRARVPHFVVTSVDGEVVDYRAIWQNANLLLVCLDESGASRPLEAIAAELAGRSSEFAALQSRLVVTRDAIHAVPRPGVVIADRWSEIHAMLDSAAVTDANDLLEWLRFIERRCG